MKISYDNLKKSLDFIWDEKEVANKLINHTAEVEEIIYEWKNFENMVVWEIKEINNHPDADKLKVCFVDLWEQKTQIVCWWTNLELWQKVAVAKIWATVSWHWWEVVTMKKTKIRWIESNWMICASEEIGLEKEFPAESHTEILDLSNFNLKVWEDLSKALNKNKIVLEIDNKAINHRPDLFSHIWIKRELATIYKKDFVEKYAKNKEFLNAQKLEIDNQIPEVVPRYMALKISWVENIETKDEEILDILQASWVDSKWLLVDLSNYSLYYYWQPTHIFDADKINWNITIRYAKSWEKFVALDDKEYELNNKNIVIADSEKILALAWIIWAKNSAVSETTKNIIIESANFDQAILRKTGKSCWVRTDSLNIFEKWLLPEMAYCGLSLIYEKLKENFSNLEIKAFWDNYAKKQKEIFIDYDLDFINNLIGKKYENNYVLEILNRLWITTSPQPSPLKGEGVASMKLKIPFWRKDLNYKADIAEEVARIDGYNNIEAKNLDINSGAVIQDNLYKIKNDTKDFFVDRGFFDTYNYSFVWEELYNKIWLSIDSCVKLKNYLSLDATHLRNSLVPNMLLWIEENIKDFKELKIFELEKVFKHSLAEEEVITENYSLTVMMLENNDNIYYKMVNELQDFFARVWIKNYFIDTTKNFPVYAHPWRVWSIIVRWKEIWIIWEIHPTIAKRFWIEKSRLAFFEINIDKILNALYSIVKAKEISIYQENNFDLSFVVDKKIKAKDIVQTILATDKKIIDRVELFDIYENKEKLPWKRSLSFKVFISSLDWTLDDKIKNELIENIVKKVEKKWGKLR